MLDANSRKSMMFHVKHISKPSTKKSSKTSDKLEIQAIWTNIQAAFYRIQPGMSRPAMIALLLHHGEDISLGTFNSYAAGLNWPGIRILKAISKATATSLDELVFGASAAPGVTDIVQAVKLLDQATKHLAEQTKIDPSQINSERMELMQRIGKLSKDDVTFLLETVRRLHGK